MRAARKPTLQNLGDPLARPARGAGRQPVEGEEALLRDLVRRRGHSRLTPVPDHEQGNVNAADEVDVIPFDGLV